MACDYITTVHSCLHVHTLQSQTNAVAMVWRRSHIHHSRLGGNEGHGIGGAGSAAEEVNWTVATVETHVTLDGVELRIMEITPHTH